MKKKNMGDGLIAALKEGVEAFKKGDLRVSMTITIITLYDDYNAETYVGAIIGTLSKKQKRKLAEAKGAARDGEKGSHEEDGRTIGFREVQIGNEPPDFLYNIWED